MPSWWKSSKEAKKKPTKESFIDTLHRKFKSPAEVKSPGKSGGSRRHSSDITSEKGSLSQAQSRASSPSKHVSRCQSFAERPLAQPLPLPGLRPANVGRSDSGISPSAKSRVEKASKPSLFLPLPKPACIRHRLDPADTDGELVFASMSSECSIESDDPIDSRQRSPLATDYETGSRTAAGSPSSLVVKDQSAVGQISSKEMTRPVSLSPSRNVSSVSPKRRPVSSHVTTLQVPPPGAFCSAPDSSMSSPSRSPMRAAASEQVTSSTLWAGRAYADLPSLGSGHCSSPGSGQNSGHNSMGGDMSGQLFWQPCRGSPEYSPIPSPRMTSPGPSSRIQSGAVTPIHPRAVGGASELQTSWPDDGRLQSHPLPLPPLTISNSSPFSHSISVATSPSVPRSPGRAENLASPGSRWKKGKLLGRGTFGHVYVGFNSDSGEMCAMKEVTLFSDDAKSKESAKQLAQEITLLSRLRHPNIVQYYGTETVGDKLYIYLEYVSGGSIYKLLQEYGAFGEAAICNYTQQILSGLAYLHAKNTVHRDIKGANILVDPNGRIKLADFGMAKHITGQSCPLSFKGSPYWMAPEVIKNSSGCNLAVDIWSLGCTVLEMATSKPPWSQYEGVAAMFKIGNSKELPAIPEQLSDEAKDFVRKCLQREPRHRPTAAQLLEHPFVKNAATLEKPNISPEPYPCTGANGVKSLKQEGCANDTDKSTLAHLFFCVHKMILDQQLVLAKLTDWLHISKSHAPSMLNLLMAYILKGIGQARNIPTSESERLAIHSSRVSKSNFHCSDIHITRNISCPVSPIGSPLLHPRSPQHLNGRLSPSPISSPITMSGSSTPFSGGTGAIPFHHLNQSVYLQEAAPLPQSPYMNGLSYWDPDVLRGPPSGSHAFRELASSQNDALGKQFGRTTGGELYDGQSVLANRVSQQLLRDHVKLVPSLDLNPCPPLEGRTGEA